MKSDYEKRYYRRLYILISSIYLVLNLILLALLAVGSDRRTWVLIILIGSTEVITLIMLYIFSARMIRDAYRSVEAAAELMKSLTDSRGEEVEPLPTVLREGSIGILYDNFEKLVDMFREGRRREKQEKEYLKDVMSDISHQLRTPLSSMDVFIDLLLNDKIATPEEEKRILEETGNQISRMEWMVLSMLKLARIEAGAISFDIRRVRLLPILEEVRGGIRYLTEQRGQRLLVECPEEIELTADPEWFTEALINIVKNASDYSATASDISISVEQNAVFTRVYIRDYGMGMSEETMTHIFERFYRAGSEVNPNSVGIGLPLSRSIVEGMGGRISVSSELGKGSLFTVQL